MKLIVVLSLLIIFIFPSDVKSNFTIIASIIWFCYSLYYLKKLYSYKDKNIVTNKYFAYPPNNNNSSNIRYLYKRCVDYKVFIANIIELLIKKSISINIKNGNYFIKDNKVKNEDLSRSESYVKKIIFKDIGNSEEVALHTIKNKCLKNSGYIFSVYKEWQSVFEYECISNKYFISNKYIVDKSLGYFVISFIISLYNILFTKKIYIAIFILCSTGYLCNYVSKIKNLEEDAKPEYKKWIEFKNYIDKYDNTLYELDSKTLENYATYAYVLDSEDSFIRILNKKKSNNNDCFKDSELLQIMSNGIFDELESSLKNSINIVDFKAKILFSKNKGRR